MGIPGCFKTGEHSDDMGIWEKNENSFQDGLEEKRNGKTAVVVRDMRRSISD